MSTSVKKAIKARHRAVADKDLLMLTRLWHQAALLPVERVDSGVKRGNTDRLVNFIKRVHDDIRQKRLCEERIQLVAEIGALILCQKDKHVAGGSLVEVHLVATAGEG